jgi:hypothetical protein
VRAIAVLVVLLTGCAAAVPVDADDPRFEACGGTAGTVDATLDFVAREYHDHFPLMGRSPELETDDPAFAVVFADGEGPPMAVHPQLELGDHDELPQPPQDSPHRTVCLYVGQPTDGVVNVYVDVDVALLLP